MGSYWVDIIVSDGELSDQLNYTIRVLQKNASGSDQNDDTIDGEFDVGDLFPPDDDDADYDVEENDNVDVEVQEDGSIDVDPKGEWEGSQEVEIEKTTEGESEVRSFRILFINENDGEPEIIEFEEDEEQVLFAVVDPDLGMMAPLRYTWYLDQYGMIGAGQSITTNLLPGTYFLIVQITDHNDRIVDETYEIRVGIDPVEEEVDGMGIQIFSLIILAIAITVVTMLLLVTFILRKRTALETDRTSSGIGSGNSHEEVSFWRERRGPSPDSSGDGPMISTARTSISGVKAGSLDTGPLVHEGRSVSSTSIRPVFESQMDEIRNLAMEWDGGDDMGMTNRELVSAIKRRYKNGEISKETYNQIIKKMDPE
jgi:uncharacterized membrane protein